MPVLVKICGLKTPEALDAALDAGADMVGFVFFPPSPRHLGIEAARALGERVQGRAKKVALSVDATDAELDRVVEALRPDMLQLHGKETPERVAAVRSRFRLPVMKALPIETRADLSPIRLYAKVADRLLFDARAPRDATRPGGLARRSTGACWRSIDLETPFMLSGGLDAGERRRGAAHHARAGGRRIIRRRTRARRERPGQDSRIHSRGARHADGRTRSAGRRIERPCACRARAHDRVPRCSSPIRSAPAPTSAGTSASTAAASSPRR